MLRDSSPFFFPYGLLCAALFLEHPFHFRPLGIFACYSLLRGLALLLLLGFQNPTEPQCFPARSARDEEIPFSNKSEDLMCKRDSEAAQRCHRRLHRLPCTCNQPIPVYPVSWLERLCAYTDDQPFSVELVGAVSSCFQFRRSPAQWIGHLDSAVSFVRAQDD